jgi:hypothetical protein
MLLVVAGMWMTCAAAWGQSPSGARTDSRTSKSERRWTPVGRFKSAEVRESSGVAKSRKYEDVFWTHGDSGNSAAIFAFRENGEVIARVDVDGATNSDWEDIAADADGYLYIGDIGNNRGVLTVRYIYKLREPDPFAAPPLHAKVEAVYVYTFEGPPFDAEALLILKSTLHIVSKPAHGSAVLYRLEAPDAQHPQRLVPRAVATLPLGAVTGGDASPDGKKLAVCTCDTLEVYRVPDVAAAFTDENLLGRVRFPSSPIEACGFDGDDVVLTAESGEIYRVRAAEFKERVVFK